jgi:hypothetical protein
MLLDFNVRVGKEDIVKPIVGNESLHEIRRDNRVRSLNVATSKNVTVRSMMTQHCNIHKFTWTSSDVKAHNEMDHILIDR